MTGLLSVLALLVSGISLIVLGLFDPKRASSRTPLTPYRRIAMVSLLLPGVVLLVYVKLAAFLIWMGGVGVLGWLVSNVLNANHPERQDSGDQEPLNETKQAKLQMENAQDPERPVHLRTDLPSACN